MVCHKKMPQNRQQKLLKKYKQSCKISKKDMGTNNFRGAAVQIKNIVEDYINN